MAVEELCLLRRAGTTSDHNVNNYLRQYHLQMGRQIIFIKAFPSPVPYAYKLHVLSAKILSVFLRENYAWPKYSD